MAISFFALLYGKKKRPYALYTLYFLSLCMLPGISVQGQDRVYRNILTSHFQKLTEASPSVKATRESLEQLTDSLYGKIEIQAVSLPLVFHIFNASSGQPLVTQGDIDLQINALNRDFNKQDYAERHPADTKEGFSALAADMQIQFCLAKPAGNYASLDPIHYLNTNRSSWPADHSVQLPDSGGVAPWNPEQYVNVWIADLEGDASGFAQMPGGPSKTDGIVIDYRFFGIGSNTHDQYKQGKTLTHLIGNYLNLYPLWGTGRRCSDDGVADTPIHNAPNSGCPTYKHVTFCDGYTVEMSMNFMDNSDDACMYMFTEGQKQRVHALFIEGGARAELLGRGAASCNTSSHFTFSDPSALPEELDDIELFPNPAKAKFSLRISSREGGELRIQVNSAIGQEVYRERMSLQQGRQEYQIFCQNWAPGVYFIQVSSPEGNFTESITIQ
ncbi:MAG: zinc-dependent metalloprotease [Bacteroidota bacterium]